MHAALGIVAGLLAISAGPPADAPKKLANRYGLAADLKTYPQATPKEALGSALKAVEKKRFDYLVAHLADPDFVDDRVRRVYGGHFDEQVDDTRARLDPGTLKQLRALLEGGVWEVNKTTATARRKGDKDRFLRLKAIGGRWFLEHRWSDKK
jgi:hypothetical protein